MMLLLWCKMLSKCQRYLQRTAMISLIWKYETFIKEQKLSQHTPRNVSRKLEVFFTKTLICKENSFNFVILKSLWTRKLEHSILRLIDTKEKLCSCRGKSGDDHISL